MTRLIAGGTPDAVATSATDKTVLAGSNTQIRYSVVVPGATFRVFQDRTGDTRLTDLLNSAGTAITKVTADDIGQLPEFSLPDGLRVDVVWLDPDDDSATRFPVSVRFGPGSADASYARVINGVLVGPNGNPINTGIAEESY